MEEALGAGWTVAGGIYILSRPPSFDNPRRAALSCPLWLCKRWDHFTLVVQRRTMRPFALPVVRRYYLLGHCEFNVGFHGQGRALDRSFNREELLQGPDNVVVV